MDRLRDIHIVTEPGIGDWLFMWKKLADLPKETRDRIVVSVQDQRPRRVDPLFPLVGVRMGAYMQFGRHMLQRNSVDGKRSWNDILSDYDTSGAEHLYLQANSIIEKGGKLEDFLPDLQYHDTIEYATTESQVKAAQKHLGITVGPDLEMWDENFVAVYTSSHHMRHWGHWGHTEWVDFLARIQTAYPNVTFVHIGAPFDVELGNVVAKEAGGINTVGRTTIAECIEILKRCSCLFAFHSGIPILAGTLKIPYLTFFPKHLLNMMHCWEPQEKYENGSVLNFKIPASPEQVFTTCMDKGWSKYLDGS